MRTFAPRILKLNNNDYDEKIDFIPLRHASFAEHRSGKHQHPLQLSLKGRGNLLAERAKGQQHLERNLH